LIPVIAFSWRARNDLGEMVEGQLEAVSEGEVVDQLMAMGMVPVRISSATEPAENNAEMWLARAGSWLGRVDQWLQRVSRKPIMVEDILLFSRQMYTLSKAGVPILKALKGLQSSVTKPAMVDVLNDMCLSLEKGRNFSTAMESHTNVFGAFYISMIKSGEMTGRLTEVFLRMNEHVAFDHDVRERIKQAIRYPIYVVVAILVALVVINIFVMPAFSNVYAGLEADLPTITRGLLAFSEVMVRWWPLLLSVCVVLTLAIKGVLRTPVGCYYWDAIKIRLPVVGDIILKATLARFSHGLALTSQSGVPLVPSLTVVAATVNNTFIGRRIKRMRRGIERGQSIAFSAAATGVFEPVALQMITVGEEAGELDDMLVEIADMYERETDYRIKGLSAAIEPILISFIGVMVLLLALGVYLPMWDLGGAM
jgi:MSHA biogenesis protein MshG